MKLICEQNREIRIIRFTMANPNPQFASIYFVRWARHTCASDLHQLMALEMVSPALEMVSLTRAVSFPPTSSGMSINPCDSADYSPVITLCRPTCDQSDFRLIICADREDRRKADLTISTKTVNLTQCKVGGMKKTAKKIEQDWRKLKIVEEKVSFQKSLWST